MSGSEILYLVGALGVLILAEILREIGKIRRYLEQLDKPPVRIDVDPFNPPEPVHAMRAPKRGE